MSVFILSAATWLLTVGGVLLAYFVAENWIHGLAHGGQAELNASHITSLFTHCIARHAPCILRHLDEKGYWLLSLGNLQQCLGRL